MNWIVVANNGYFVSTNGGITLEKEKARWFFLKEAKRKKAEMNRKTNPRMTWSVERRTNA